MVSHRPGGRVRFSETQTALQRLVARRQRNQRRRLRRRERERAQVNHPVSIISCYCFQHITLLITLFQPGRRSQFGPRTRVGRQTHFGRQHQSGHPHQSGRLYQSSRGPQTRNAVSTYYQLDNGKQWSTAKIIWSRVGVVLFVPLYYHKGKSWDSPER